MVVPDCKQTSLRLQHLLELLVPRPVNIGEGVATSLHGKFEGMLRKDSATQFESAMSVSRR